MPIALLLAMQASGMIVDWIGTREQQRMMGMGEKLQQASIESNIETTRLNAENDSLQALINLRKNLGSQAAIFAARGTRAGTGSALAFMTESVGNFNTDERMRKINLLNRETALKSEGTISKLNASAEKAKLWQGFGQRTINRLSSSPSAWGQAGKSFGLTNVGS